MYWPRKCVGHFDSCETFVLDAGLAGACVRAHCNRVPLVSIALENEIGLGKRNCTAGDESLPGHRRDGQARERPRGNDHDIKRRAHGRPASP